MNLKKNNIKKILAFSLAIGVVASSVLSAYASSENTNIDNNKIKSIEHFEDKIEELDIRTSEESKSIVKKWVNSIKDKGFQYDVNKGLSPEEIDKRYSEISEKYDLFEQVSNEDAEFLIAYQNVFESINQNGKNVNTKAIDQNKPIKRAQKTSSGVTAAVFGSLRHKGGKATSLKNSYGGSVYFNIVGGASKVKSIEGQIRHEAWGIAGENGVVKVYNDKIKYLKTKAPFATSYVDRDEPYTAYVSIMKTSAYMIINHQAGQFNVSAGV